MQSEGAKVLGADTRTHAVGGRSWGLQRLEDHCDRVQALHPAIGLTHNLAGTKEEPTTGVSGTSSPHPFRPYAPRNTVAHRKLVGIPENELKG